MKNNIKRFFMAVSILLVSSQTFGSSVYLDGDSLATGSALGTTPLVTALGQITFEGEFRTTADADFIAAGSVGNVFDIDDVTGTASLAFDFDAQSISFIFGGNLGAFDIFALDILGNTVASFSASTGDGDFAGPVTLAGAGIRSLFWKDIGYNFAALDNITISAVPVPAAAWLFGSALLGFFGFSRKKANA